MTRVLKFKAKSNKVALSVTFFMLLSLEDVNLFIYLPQIRRLNDGICLFSHRVLDFDSGFEQGHKPSQTEN